MFNVMESIRAFVADEFGFLIYLYGIIVFAMIIDFGTGLAKAKKQGNLSSSIGKDGLIKKVTILLILLLTFFVSFIFPDGTGTAANVAVWFGFLGFECVSIVENCYVLGINVGPLEKFLKVAKLEPEEDEKEVEDVKPKVD